ncbi:MAG: hypothetical protein MZV63_48990 [Marinilabiliales bacterium]|nr:hypothetical protein [Marinilabiliales bacterium]
MQCRGKKTKRPWTAPGGTGILLQGLPLADHEIIRHLPLKTIQYKGFCVYKNLFGDKWMTTIEKEIQTKVESITQRFSQHINELSERHRNTLSDFSGKFTGYETKVLEHLAKMGY